MIIQNYWQEGGVVEVQLVGMETFDLKVVIICRLHRQINFLQIVSILPADY